jgi:hypothetical protein
VVSRDGGIQQGCRVSDGGWRRPLGGAAGGENGGGKEHRQDGASGIHGQATSG